MQKQGVITYWNEVRGFGFISVTRAHRYYFHVSQISEGPIGSLFGLPAWFDLLDSDQVLESSNPAQKLPEARNVRIAVTDPDASSNSSVDGKGGAQ